LKEIFKMNYATDDLLVAGLFCLAIIAIIAGIYRHRHADVLINGGIEVSTKREKPRWTLDAWITTRLLDAGFDLDLTEAKIILGICIVIVGAFIWILTGSLLVGMVAGAAGVPTSVNALAGYARTRRRHLLEEQFSHSLVALAAQMEAGMTVQGAFAYTEQVSPEPIKTIFKRITDEMSLGGSGLEQALRSVTKYINIEDWEAFVAACSIGSHAGGGELPVILANLSQAITERSLMRSHTHSLLMEALMSRYVLAALPPLVFLYEMVADRNSFVVLTQSSSGIVMLIVASALWVVGNFVISRMIKRMEVQI
jgi:tight adherence protein B